MFVMFQWLMAQCTQFIHSISQPMVKLQSSTSVGAPPKVVYFFLHSVISSESVLRASDQIQGSQFPFLLNLLAFRDSLFVRRIIDLYFKTKSTHGIMVRVDIAG